MKPTAWSKTNCFSRYFKTFLNGYICLTYLINVMDVVANFDVSVFSCHEWTLKTNKVYLRVFTQTPRNKYLRLISSMCLCTIYITLHCTFSLFMTDCHFFPASFHLSLQTNSCRPSVITLFLWPLHWLIPPFPWVLHLSTSIEFSRHRPVVQ